MFRLNEILGNKGHGILCDGNLNLTKIMDNTFIGLNDLCGIFVNEHAYVTINKNLIT